MPREPLPNSFTPVAADYFLVKLVNWSLSVGCALLVAVVPLIFKFAGLNVPLWLMLAPPVAVLGIGVLTLRLMRRQVRALGYLERDEDLVVRSGVLWRKQLVIPYGRMQYVEVTSGPIERRYRLCKLTLNTAGSAATAVIPGLPEDAGAALRERLTAAGEAKMI